MLLDASSTAAMAQVFATVAPGQKEIAAIQALLTEKKVELSQKESDSGRLEQLEKDEYISRALGEPYAPDQKPKRLARIRNLRNDIVGLKGAIPILGNRLRDAIAAGQQASRERPSQVMPLIRQSRDSALEDVRAELVALLPKLSRLAAHDQLQQRLLGSGAGKALGSEDFAPERLVRAMLDKIPQRLRPEPEAVEACLSEAQKLGDEAADMILKGNVQ